MTDRPLPRYHAASWDEPIVLTMGHPDRRAMHAPEIEPELYDFLDGVPPAGAQAKRLTGAAGAVWLYRQMYYLKTAATLISPAWRNRADASDGTTVYKLSPIPVLVLSDRGRELRARVR